MEEDKGILVPINYDGKWRKNDECVWVFDALQTSYVKVYSNTSFVALLGLISSACDVDMMCNEIELTSWNMFPSKQIMPPFKIRTDADVQNFIELNGGRDMVSPICLTSKGRKHTNAFVVPKVPAVVFCKSESVDQKQFKVEKDEIRMSVCGSSPGLDDIKFEEQPVKFPLTECETEYNVYNDVEVVDDGSNSDDTDDFEYDDAFSFEPDFVDVDGNNDKDDADDCRAILDPYFHVYLGSPSKGIGSPSISQFTGNDDHNFNPERAVPAEAGTSTLQSTNIHTLEDFVVGELVASKDAFSLRLRVICSRENREFLVTHSNRNRVIARCVDPMCQWRIRCVNMPKIGGWVIRTYVKEHNCSLDLRFKRQRGIASSQVIAHMIKHDDMDTTKTTKKLQRDYGINIKYWKTWKAKQIAQVMVRGRPEESYKALPSYLWLLEKYNPGTYTAYRLDENKCFQQCFLSYGSSIVGFRSAIRPVIAVDACFLKGRFRGVLLLATTMDGNGQIYPLAFGVAPNESDETWSCFFEQLRHVVGMREELVFISDRHPSIEKCCTRVFPEATYGTCIFHLGMNMHAKFKIKPEEFLYGAAKAFTEAEFEDRMRHVYNTRRQVYDYLIAADPKKWARCYFPSKRYSIMTTNIAESMNALLKEARQYPIIGILETIREILQRWFHDRLNAASGLTSSMTPKVERKLTKMDDECRRFSFAAIDDHRFDIRDGFRAQLTVDLKLKMCTCNAFQIMQVPCPHAIRACREQHISVYSLCSRYYSVESLKLAYAVPVLPVLSRSEWHRIVPDNVQFVKVKPSLVKNKRGRPRNNRICSQGEFREPRRCGKCREFGHNKKICNGYEFVEGHPNDKEM